VNIAMVLEMAADGMGDRVAIGGLTYADVRARARAVAERLAGTDTAALATLLPNGEHLPVALFGAAWAGVSYAPLNYRLPEDVQAELLGRLQPAEVFDGTWADAAEGATPYVEDPTRPAVLLFTSGTSSAPKAAVLNHDNLTAYLFNTLEFASADEDEAALLAVPPFHIAGVAAVLSSTYVGRRLVPMARFDADEWLQVAADERITHAFVVPTMLARIVTALEADASRVPGTLRHLAYGGARMPAPVLERALELLPDVGFVNAYGLTETSSTVAVLGPDDHRAAITSDDPLVRRRLESCGRAVPGVEFAVVDGEVWIRGDQVGGGYVGSESQVDADGWLHTGDRGFIDDDGYVFVTGRADDMIIRGGENISPTEIEDTLLRHADVTAVAVVGLPDLEWGERLAAMIVPVDTATFDVGALQVWAKEQLGTIKTPELIVVADELPATPTGKILRRVIKEQLAERSPGPPS
jgi:acyl-CoA synthetase (AMP-forming)/AMP-acid ligase II